MKVMFIGHGETELRRQIGYWGNDGTTQVTAVSTSIYHESDVSGDRRSHQSNNRPGDRGTSSPGAWAAGGFIRGLPLLGTRAGSNRLSSPATTFDRLQGKAAWELLPTGYHSRIESHRRSKISREAHRHSPSSASDIPQAHRHQSWSSLQFQFERTGQRDEARYKIGNDLSATPCLRGNRRSLSESTRLDHWKGFP